MLPASKADEISLATAAEFVSYSEINEDGNAVTRTETTPALECASAMCIEVPLGKQLTGRSERKPKQQKRERECGTAL